MPRAASLLASLVLVVVMMVPIVPGVPAIPAAGAAALAGSTVPGRYIVILKRGADSTAKANSLTRQHGLGLRHVYGSVFKGFAVTIPLPMLTKIMADTDVVAIVEDRVVTATDTVPTGVARIQAPENPSVVSGPIGVGVAVLDTGIDASHPDLNVAGGKACVTGDATTNDIKGHGTHVAGTIGAKNNGSGVVGVAPGAPLYAVKVLNDTGNGSWSDVICGIDWVAKSGVKVANLSLAGGGSDDGNCGYTNNDPLHQAICTAVNTYGVTFVVAAGNGGFDAAGMVPAAYNEVITVSSMADSDGKPCGVGPAIAAGDDVLSPTSNYGADVDLAAPGDSILSTLPGGAEGYKSGTSMASPHVAGAAALYIAANGAVGPAAVRAGLINEWQSGPIPGDPDGTKEGIVNVKWTTNGGVPVVRVVAPDTAQVVSGNAVGVAFTAEDKDPWCRLASSPGQVTATARSKDDDSVTALTVAYNVVTERFEAIWDTAATDTDGVPIDPDGEYTITTTAKDSGGKIGTQSVEVIVENGVVVNRPPVVSFTTPAANTAVHGTITLEATASDSDGTVAGVEFAYAPSPSGVNSTWTAIAPALTAEPYQATWDTAATGAGGTRTVADGIYDLRVTATDDQGAPRTALVTVTVDNTAPTMTGTVPSAQATGVQRGTNVTATFSEALNAGTVSTTSFTLTGPGNTAVPAAVTYDPVTRTATLNPTTDLSPTTVYTATVTVGVTDTVGIPLAADVTWTFTTVAADATPPTVTANPAGGAYRSSQSVRLTANETATIYYTTNGNNPTTASPRYTNPITIGSGTTRLKYFAVDTAGNASAVVTQTYVVDNVAPATPAGLTTTVLSGGVQLAWQAATDNSNGSGIAGYEVYRDGTKISGSSLVTGTGYTDSANPTNGFRYKYEVKAVDAAGNISGLSAAAVAFADGFAQGLNRWSNQGLVTSSSGYAGAAVQAKTTNAGKYARATLGTGQADLSYRVRFKIVSQGSSTFSLLKVRTGATSCGSSLLTITVDNKGKLGYRNDVSGASTTTSTVVSKGNWHEVQVRVRINGSSSIVEIWYHGSRIVNTTTSLGTTLAGCLQLGEDAGSRSYDVLFDDVVAETVRGSYSGPAATDETPAGSDPTPAPTATPKPKKAANAKPTAAAGPDQTVTDEDLDETETVTLDGSASKDKDGSLVAYEWQDADGAVVATGAIAEISLPVGRHVLTLVVTDDRGKTDTDRLVVKVKRGNAPPIADAGPDQTVVDADDDGAETVMLDGSASTDPEGKRLGYAWSVDGRVVADNAKAEIAFPVGETVVTLTVTDAGGAEDANEVVVIVEPAPPVETTPTETPPAEATPTEPAETTNEETETPDEGASPEETPPSAEREATETPSVDESSE